MSSYPKRLRLSGLAVAEAARLLVNMLCHAGTIHKSHPLVDKLSKLGGDHEWQDHLWSEEQERLAKLRKRKKKRK